MVELQQWRVCNQRGYPVELFYISRKVAEAWIWLRSRLLQLLPTTIGAAGISSEDFLLLQFPHDTMDKECVWLIGNFCDVVNSSVIGRQSKLGADQLAGRIRARLARIRGRAVVQPSLYNI